MEIPILLVEPVLLRLRILLLDKLGQISSGYLLSKSQKGTYIAVADWLTECVGKLLSCVVLLQLNRIL